MMNLDALKASMPRIAETLGKMMVDEVLTMMGETGITLDEIEPAASMVYGQKDGGRDIKVTLSISYAEEGE